MAFDSSGILAAKAPDILPMIQGVQAYKNALAANPGIQAESAQAQADLAAKTSYGNALINPDGTINPTAGAQSARANPAAAAGLGQIGSLAIAQTQGNANAGTAQQQLSQETLKTHLMHLSQQGNIAASILSQTTPQTDPTTGKVTEVPKQLTSQDVANGVAQVVKASGYDDNDIKQYVNNATTALQNLGPDPDPRDPAYEVKMGQRDAQIRAMLTPLMVAGQTAQQQVEQATGKLSTVDTGGYIQPVVSQPLNPQAGAQPVGTPLKKGLTPEAAASPVAGPADAQGKPTTVPLGQRQNMGIITIGLGPAGSAAASVQGQTAASRASALQDAAQGVNSRKALLETLQNKLQNFTPGPQADLAKTFGQLAQEYHLPFSGALAQGTASQEEYAKLATQLAQQQFAAIGGTGTDAKLSSAVHTSPSEFLSKEGNQGIISLLKGNEDALSVKAQMWQKWSQTHPAETYDNFSNAFNNKFDPRVFQSVYQSPADVRAQVNAMTPAERAAFQNKYNYAVHAGWIPNPGGQ